MGQLGALLSAGASGISHAVGGAANSAANAIGLPTGTAGGPAASTDPGTMGLSAAAPGSNPFAGLSLDPAVQQGVQSNPLSSSLALPPMLAPQSTGSSDSLQSPFSPNSPLYSLFGNPYAGGYSGSSTNPAQQAASIDSNTPSSSGSTTINAQDKWTPAHTESTLAKVGDFFFHNMFRNRTAQANERDVMQNYYSEAQRDAGDPNALKQDQLVAQSRMEKIPGADPSLAGNIGEQVQRGNYFDSVGQSRIDQARRNASDSLSGIASVILNKVPADQQEAVWTKNLPLMQSIAKNGSLDSSLIPTDFDPDRVQGMIGAGFSAPDQARTQIEGQRVNNEATNINSQITAREAAIQQRQFQLGLAAKGFQLKQQSQQDLSEYRKFTENYLTNKTLQAATQKTIAGLPQNPPDYTMLTNSKDPNNRLMYHKGTWYMIRVGPDGRSTKLLGKLPGQGSAPAPTSNANMVPGTNVPDLTGDFSNSGNNDNNDDIDGQEY